MNETEASKQDESENIKPKKNINKLKRMSQAIEIPTFDNKFLDTLNKNTYSPASPNHPTAKKFTTKLYEENNNFGLTEDLYTSKEEIKIEEKSEETSQSNFR